MRLQYDVGIVGIGALKRGTKTIERTFVRHKRALERIARQQRRGPTSADAAMKGEQKRHAMVMRNLGKERAAMAATAKSAAAVQASSDRKNHSRRMSQARREAAARKRFARSVVTGVGRRASGLVSSVGAFGTMAAGIGGGLMAASAFRGMTAKDKAARALANQAFNTSGSNGATREELRQDILNTSKPVALASGTPQAEVIGGMRQFMSKAGDINAAKQIAPFLADIADASETDLKDAGEAAGQVFMSAIAQGLSGEDALKATKDIIAVMGGQAKEGAIELKDMAAQAGKLMSAAGQFKGDAADLANTMGAVGQMAIAGGASSPEEAMTALMRLPDDIVKASGPRGAFKKAGINVFTDKTKTALRDPAELIMEAVSKTGGDLTKLKDMFGLRSKKAVDPFRKAFVEAGGGDKGNQAMRDMFSRFTSLKMSSDEIGASAAFAREGTGKRFARIKERLDQKLGPAVMRVIERMIPALEKMIPHLEKAGDVLARFIEWFSENPLTGIGAIISATVVAEIAKAAIGSAITSALTAAMSGPLVAGIAPVLAALGPFALALGAAALAALAVKRIYEGWTSNPESSGVAALDRAQIARDTENFLSTQQPVTIGPLGDGFNMEEDYRRGLDPTGRPRIDPSIAHPQVAPAGTPGDFAADRSRLEKILKVEGGDKFESAAAQLQNLPAALDGVLSKYSAGPNRGFDPTAPRSG